MASLIRYMNNKRKEKRESEDMKCENGAKSDACCSCCCKEKIPGREGGKRKSRVHRCEQAYYINVTGACQHCAMRAQKVFFCVDVCIDTMESDPLVSKANRDCPVCSTLVFFFAFCRLLSRLIS